MKIEISKVFNCINGNTGLTEEYIYSKLLSPGEKYQVLTAATIDDNHFGAIPITDDEKKLGFKTFEDHSGILVIRKGKAGFMKLVFPGKYILNDDVYILALRDDFKNEFDISSEIEELIFLNWFISSKKIMVSEFASSSDNSTWNKSLFFKFSVLEIPSKKEIEKISFLYSQLIEIRNSLASKLKYLDISKRKLNTSSNFFLEVHKIKEMFTINQGHQITDLELYLTEGNIPVFSGNNEIKGYWNKAIVNDFDLPCISYPTKANTGNLFLQNDIFDANNTAVLIPKNDWREKLALEWFLYKLPSLFLQNMTSKEGVSYLNKSLVEEIELGIPTKDQQEEEVVILQSMSIFENKLAKVLYEVDKLLMKEVI